MKYRIVVLFIILIEISIPLCFADMVKLVVDDRYWYPFTYTEDKQAKGMHVDIVKKALNTLGYSVQITPLPRKRCFHKAKYSDIDGIVSVAYHKDSADSLYFPKGAATDRESPLRIMQIDHVVVTYYKDKFEFEGDIKSLPDPVRVPKGESIATELKNAGHKIDTARTDYQNFGKLIRDKEGSVITTSLIAEKMSVDPKFSGQFIIHATPFISKSYYLAFSKNTKLSAEARQKIWQEIARWRDDYVYTLKLFAQY